MFLLKAPAVPLMMKRICDLDNLTKKFLMKKLFCIIFLFSLLFTHRAFSQQDSLLFHNKKFTKHLSFKDTFFGSEDMFQVCYPKEHRNFFYFIILFSITKVVLGIIIIYIKSSSNKKLKEKMAYEVCTTGKVEVQNLSYNDSSIVLKAPQILNTLPDAIVGFVLSEPPGSIKGKVIDEAEKGYKLGDKVIRFAKVIIAQ